MHSATFIFCVILCFVYVFGDEASLYQDEVRSLSELPMDKLIQIKSSLCGDNVLDHEVDKELGVSSRKLSLTLPVALPLKRSNKKPMRRYEEHYEEKGKDTKISKIFQLAVTSLSFLAFGGYLLTLIISAIRRNSSMNNNGNVIVLSNLQNLQKYKRPKRSAVFLDPMENNFNTDRLYEGMIMLSRSYASYN
ncbi:hypothetical protein KM043_018419 [Ampulex compressa]|nr:hypothetical protein KM043_018419 [Ampulex compressa]